MPRRFPIFQLPNPPMTAAIIAAAVALRTDGATATNARILSQLAMLVWAYEEIVSGANWFRRLLGVAEGVRGISTLRRLLRRRRSDRTAGHAGQRAAHWPSAQAIRSGTRLISESGRGA
jgi:hypothetical protein